MQKKITGWKTKGMNRDLSVSAYNPEFAFENINLRLSTNEGNTMLSWVNERGPKELSVSIDEKPWITDNRVYQIGDVVNEVALVEGDELVGKDKYTTTSIEGVPIGTAVINHQLVLFTTENIQDEYNSPSHLRPPRSFDFDVTYTNYEGHGEPDNDVGNNHDTYTDLDTGETYTKTGGEWVKDTPVVTPDPGEPVVEPGDPIVNPGTEGGDDTNIGGEINNEPDVPATRTIDDRIYVLWFDGENMLGKLIYAGVLNFNTVYPLETLVSYESSNVQKVYWTDGLNQPRIINIKADDSKLRQWNLAVNNTIDTFFDFIPSIATLGSTTVTVTKQSGDGTFAPGVIQYAFTYINKYGQQSNAFYVSPLYYISHNDRGASPEDKVSCQFDISITSADTNFDYVRVYSIQRTSINMEPFVKFLEDLKITGDTLKYTDNGTTGSTVDPTEMLYVGGKEITALTMTEKDHTLFMGNIVQRNTSVDAIQDWFDDLRKPENSENKIKIEFQTDQIHTTINKVLSLKPASGVYSYTNELDNNRREITTFKGGDKYRFGFQLQKVTGEWLEPIFIDDKTNDKYPFTTIAGNEVYLPYATATINLSSITGVDWSVFKNIRPVVVYPTIVDRNVLCQGVLNPTVFNALDRIDNSPYAQASWYFRPYTTDSDNTSGSSESSVVVEAVDEPEPMPSYPNVETKSVYLLIADVNNLKLSDILLNGFLTYRINSIGENNTVTNTKINIDGAILIEKGSDSTKVAFFKTDSAWEGELVQYNNSSPATPILEKYYVELCEDTFPNPNIIIKTSPISIFKSIQSNSSSLYYYNKYSDEHTASYNNYYFSFTDGLQQPTSYFFKFTSVDSVSDNNTVYFEGSKTVFKHLDRLPTDKDAYMDYDVGIINFGVFNPNRLRKVEVQGAAKIYSSVFSTEKNKDEDGNSLSTNNQFFIDQNIVTLNSPDIEFDTEVQTYSMENLKLRIVGAIPITASASWHNITSSSMLNQRFNMKGDTDEAKSQSKKFGQGELSGNVLWNNVSINAGRRLIAEYLWDDVIVYVPTGNDINDVLVDSEVGIFAFGTTKKLIYPWHKKGSLCDDPRTEDKAASILKKKVESNILYSYNTMYLNDAYLFQFTNTDNENIFADFDIQLHLTENSNIVNVRLNRGINYYPNIDKLLYNDKGIYEKRIKITKKIRTGNSSTISEETELGDPISAIVPMKYKSTSHAVISINCNSQIKDIADNPTNHLCTPILPYGSSQNVPIGKYSYPSSVGEHDTFWGDKVYVAQGSIDLDGIRALNQNLGQYQYLWLGELYKPAKTEYFGGTTKEAIKANNWVVGGEAQSIPANGIVGLKWTEGDTYYQRYDCLKTYAYTPEDINQIVEILSFMCETHVNLDGRYDKNRGQIDNTNMSPQNFNLLNLVYTQQDNFFSYKKSDTDTNEDLKYPNYIYYSKTKQSGADVDLYTNVTLGSVLELDGNKGSINSLQRINDQIIAFQDTGISQILYNENAAISTTQGVPIELGNSGKVQGARYLSDTIGCSNKWSIASAPTGLYFIDSNSKGIFRFDGKLNNLSTSLGFNSWSKQNIHYTGGYWTPDSFDDFVTYYDKVNQDILFINKKTALSYSEKFQMFQSFYDYNEAPYLVNLDDKSLWINTDTSGTYKLWEHNAGEYCNFFGTVKPFSMTLIGNPEPQMDKIFTNLEFRASVGDDGEYVDNTGKFTPTLPFDSLETWNEYQHGITNLKNLTGIDAVRHHIGNDSSLKRKFRMWRCDIPRDNADLSKDAGMNISRYKIHPMDRMRNPWLYLKLTKNAHYTDEEVTEHNSKIDGAVTVNTLNPESDTVEYYTKEQANTLNTSIEGAWQYNTQPKSIKKTEIHDLLMTYFS